MTQGLLNYNCNAILISFIRHMSSDIPLSPNAQKLLDRIAPKIDRELQKIKKIPVSVLIWGPNPLSDSAIAKTRVALRAELRSLGHLAVFSEEIITEDAISLRMQQLAHAQQFDLIVSIPYTPGSIGEIHDFASDSRVNSKLLVCLNSEFMGGYSNQSLMSLRSVLTYEIITYNGHEELSIIHNLVIEHVHRIREIKYFNEGRK